MALSGDLDVQRKMHIREASQLHQSLSHTRIGRFLSEFLAMVTEFKTTGRNATTQGVVNTLATLLLSCLASPTSRRLAGFFTNDGKIPKFIVVAEIMGRRLSIWSDSQAVVREIVACFYNPSTSSYNQSSILRNEIDRMVDESNVADTTFVLVLASLWGGSVNDRFWRFFSLRQVEEPEANFVNSEFCLTSLQTPPAPPAGEISCIDEVHVPERELQSFCQEFKCVCIDDGEGQNDSCDNNEIAAQPSSEATDKRYKIMQELTNRVRKENIALQSVVKECTDRRESDAEQIKALQQTQSMLYCDVHSQERSLEMHSNETTRISIAMLAIRAEIENLEAELGVRHAVLREKQGEILVLQDGVATAKAARSEEIDKLKESLKKSQAALKHSNTSAKQDNAKSLEAKAYTQHLESSLEAANAEISRLTNNVDDVNRQANEAKKSSSETITRLMDSKIEAKAYAQHVESSLDLAKAEVSRLTTHVGKLEASIKSMKSSQNNQKNAEREHRYNRRMQAFVFVAKIVRMRVKLDAAQMQLAVDKQSAAAAEAAAKAESSSPVSVQHPDLAPAPAVDAVEVPPVLEKKAEGSDADVDYSDSSNSSRSFVKQPFPADTVASAKQCISTLSRWIEQTELSYQSGMQQQANSPLQYHQGYTDAGYVASIHHQNNVPFFNHTQFHPGPYHDHYNNHAQHQQYLQNHQQFYANQSENVAIQPRRQRRFGR
jgi:hypothetical protein